MGFYTELINSKNYFMLSVLAVAAFFAVLYLLALIICGARAKKLRGRKRPVMSILVVLDVILLIAGILFAAIVILYLYPQGSLAVTANEGTADISLWGLKFSVPAIGNILAVMSNLFAYIVFVILAVMLILFLIVRRATKGKKEKAKKSKAAVANKDVKDNKIKDEDKSFNLEALEGRVPAELLEQLKIYLDGNASKTVETEQDEMLQDEIEQDEAVVVDADGEIEIDLQSEETSGIDAEIFTVEDDSSEDTEELYEIVEEEAAELEYELEQNDSQETENTENDETEFLGYEQEYEQDSVIVEADQNEEIEEVDEVDQDEVEQDQTDEVYESYEIDETEEVYEIDEADESVDTVDENDFADQEQHDQEQEEIVETDEVYESYETSEIDEENETDEINEAELDYTESDEDDYYQSAFAAEQEFEETSEKLDDEGTYNTTDEADEEVTEVISAKTEVEAEKPTEAKTEEKAETKAKESVAAYEVPSRTYGNTVRPSSDNGVPQRRIIVRNPPKQDVREPQTVELIKKDTKSGNRAFNISVQNSKTDTKVEAKSATKNTIASSKSTTKNESVKTAATKTAKTTKTATAKVEVAKTGSQVQTKVPKKPITVDFEPIKTTDKTKTIEKPKTFEQAKPTDRTAASEKTNERITKKVEPQIEELPVRRKVVLQNRYNAVNLFNDYLKQKSNNEKKQLEQAINEIVIK